MRFLKIYFATIIIILILALFLYAMSFVYVQSVQTSAGVNVPMINMDKQDNEVVFSVLGRDISIDADRIKSQTEKIISYLPVEFKAAYKAVDYTENLASDLYNKWTQG